MNQAATQTGADVLEPAQSPPPPTRLQDASLVEVDQGPKPKVASSKQRVRDLITLTKPRIAMMVLITAYIGFAFGAVGSAWSWTLLLATLVGTCLTCMGSAVLNQVYERDTDAKMQRTQNRPLAAGRVSPRDGVIFGGVLAIAGLVVLIGFTTWAATAACAFTILSYTLVYTPLKRRHWSSTHIGAIPGAMPPVIGYLAATGIPSSGWAMPAVLLFSMMLLWQVPHFLAIVWLYRDDYARAGLPLLGVIDPDGHRTFRQIVATCLLLLPVGLLPTFLGTAGWIYFAVALLCGIA
ncbi:MAG: heme o synthase, partial [Firmicutes bacterium]|nr:heme o synthase [Bacillota bacterium]